VGYREIIMPSYQITSPTGEKFKITAPEGATQEEILNYAKQNFEGKPIEEKEPDGFVENVASDLEKRSEAIQETMAAERRGEIGSIQGATQAFGQAAGGVLDVVGEGVSAAVEAIPEAIKEPVVEAATDAYKWVSQTDAGRAAGEAISSGMEAYGAWKEKNPQEAKTLESATNIGILFAPIKVKQNAPPTKLGEAASYLEKVATRQIQAGKKSFVDDLISPKKTPAVKIAETARTAEKGMGLTKRSVVELSKKEQEIAKEVVKIKNVSNRKSIQGNLNAISSANSKIAKQLDRDVGTRKIIGLRESAAKSINDSVAKLASENPVITGNAVTVANKVAEKAKAIIAESPSTPKGLLNSRKALDKWIKSQKGSKAFDPELESALSVAVRDVRNTINDAVEKSTGNVAVKKELKRQSLLFDAMENLAPKAADESNFAIGRLIQNTAKALPWRRSFQTDVGMIMGLGVLSASETLAPIFATGLGIAAAGMGAKKLVISPMAKKGLSNLIKTTDRAILSSKNPSMIKQLRADKAAVLELIKTAETSEEQEE
jgi:hypothetical protein